MRSRMSWRHSASVDEALSRMSCRKMSDRQNGRSMRAHSCQKAITTQMVSLSLKALRDVCVCVHGKGCVCMVCIGPILHTCSSYTPLRMVLAAETGHLRTSPALEKQYGAPSSESSSVASELSAASGFSCGQKRAQCQ